MKLSKAVPISCLFKRLIIYTTVSPRAQLHLSVRIMKTFKQNCLVLDRQLPTLMKDL